jgi:N-methylhydantoinase A/oxoprolinase/acetone carboxylase beta subunit
MKLIVDSGSTKTDWIGVDENDSKVFETQTLGLNPQVLTSNIIKERVINNFELYQSRKKNYSFIFLWSWMWN